MLLPSRFKRCRHGLVCVGLRHNGLVWANACQDINQLRVGTGWLGPGWPSSDVFLQAQMLHTRKAGMLGHEGEQLARQRTLVGGV